MEKEPRWRQDKKITPCVQGNVTTIRQVDENGNCRDLIIEHGADTKFYERTTEHPEIVEIPKEEAK